MYACGIKRSHQSELVKIQTNNFKQNKSPNFVMSVFVKIFYNIPALQFFFVISYTQMDSAIKRQHLLRQKKLHKNRGHVKMKDYIEGNCFLKEM